MSSFAYFVCDITFCLTIIHVDVFISHSPLGIYAEPQVYGRGKNTNEHIVYYTYYVCIYVCLCYMSFVCVCVTQNDN